MKGLRCLFMLGFGVVLVLSIQPLMVSAQQSISLADQSVTTASGQSVTISIVAIATGVLDLNTLSATQGSDGAVSVDSSNGDVVYTPDSNFIGTDQFVVRVAGGLPIDSIRVPSQEELSDDSGRVYAESTITVNVTPEASGSVLGATDDSSQILGATDELANTGAETITSQVGAALIAIVALCLIFVSRHERRYFG